MVGRHRRIQIVAFFAFMDGVAPLLVTLDDFGYEPTLAIQEGKTAQCSFELEVGYLSPYRRHLSYISFLRFIPFSIEMFFLRSQCSR